MDKINILVADDDVEIVYIIRKILAEEGFNVLECEFPYKSRVMPTSEPLKTLKAPYMARNTMKWGFFRLKSQ